MSFELLLMLAVFVLLPLLQQLLRSLRQPDQRTPDRAGTRPPASEYEPAMEEIGPPEHEPLRRAPAGPRLPATARHKRPMTEPEPASAREAVGPVAPALAARRRARRRTIADLRNPRGLRRAIVLATILGPCRASQQ